MARTEITELHDNSLREQWSFQPGVTYLNHGSFGPSPRAVLAARQEWVERLQGNPMDFFVRQMEEHLAAARTRLGAFIGTKGENLFFIENATFGMNILAASFPLTAGDEVLATDHEYGAVLRIWRRTCQRAGATLKVQPLPETFVTDDEVVEAFLAGVTPRTRLLIVSHVTSPTAVILPVQKICARARKLGVKVCIDGPHAPAAVPMDLDRLGCDFYTASCHKWLSAPFGSGFLYAHPRAQQTLQPLIMSWGESLSGRRASWLDEFTWTGTRDPSTFLAVSAAIDFFEELGIEKFRQRSHALARYAREQITGLTGLAPLVPDSPDWYSTMISLPLPATVGEPPTGHMHPLQSALWEQHRIEVPIVNWHDRRFVRVSCHLYNSTQHVDRLVGALGECLRI